MFTVAEPGWTMFMISHFHYDPVWWNTQAAYTSLWSEEPPGRSRQTNGFDLVRAHLEMARRDPEYKFVLAEVDYLKPFWDAHPEDRADLRRFIADGRVEVMGGTYNEPNTNLTSPETTIRNFVHGIGFQRDVLGADPATAWQLDVFGHDPQFPGMAADAGLTSSSWARGPHHQWGPMQNDGDPERMQFTSEFEWIAPSGRGLLTHYMPAHYSAGWWMDSSATLEEAETATYELFSNLKRVALTRNVLLPVGTDYTPPNKWVTEIHRDWNARYTWPRFVCGLPSEFFAAVRAELDDRGIDPSPQTRDMNPIYTGKDVSYIDTKQANRDAENAVLDGEKFAVFAGLLGGATYPQAALDKAWVQLAYGAHHDAITGSESDQVYLDLLTGWRDAWELGRSARDNALALMSGAVDGSVVAWNTLTHKRTDVVTARLDEPIGDGVRVIDADGTELPALVEHGGRSVTWLARDVPSLGWRGYRLAAGSAQGGWEPVGGRDFPEITNEHYRLRVDPARGGAVSSLTDDGRELLADGKVGNELAVYDEYPVHPDAGEGPWHLLPKGPVVGLVGASPPSRCRPIAAPLGERLVVRGRIGTVLRYTQTLTLWHGVARVDCRTTIDEFTGEDRLLRLRWPCPVPGAMPVSEVGDAVIGRGFALLHEPGTDESVDTAKHPWTLDNPAYGWFGLSSAVRVRVADEVRAVSVAEVVSPNEAKSAPLARDLMVALVRAGVTATCSSADKPRYGDLTVDSNLPDARIALGGPDQNAFTAAVLAEADPVYTEELKRQLYASGARQGLGARRGTAGDDLGARCGPAARSGAAGARHRQRRRPRRRGCVGRRRPRRRRDLGRATGAVGAGALRAADRCGAEPRCAGLRRRHRRHPAHLADAFLHRLAVRRVDGPAAASHRTRRLELPAAALDPHVRLRGGHRRRRLALGGRSHPQRGVLASAVGRHRKRQRRRRIAQLGLAVGNRTRGVRPARCTEGGGQPARLRQQSARRPGRVGGGPARRNIRDHNRCRDHVGTAPVVWRRASICSSSPACRSTVHPRGSRMHGFEIATVLTRLNLPQLLDADHTQLAPDAEAAQPLYARYWLHNRGPGTARRAARRRTSASAALDRRPECRSAAAAYRGQRLHRHRAARQGAAGVPRRAGRPIPAESAVHAAPRRAPGDRHRVDDATGTAPGLVSGARGTGLTGDDAGRCRRHGGRSSRTCASYRVGTPSQRREMVYAGRRTRRRRGRGGRGGPADGHRRHRRPRGPRRSKPT